MGKLIYLEDYRRKRCLEALMLDIGMPDYCDECGDNVEALLLAGMLEEMDEDLVEDLIPIPASSLPIPLPTTLPTAPPSRRRRSSSAHNTPRKSRKHE
jgi:hypothetical protein